VLGCTEGTIKAHLAKARRTLARQLQPELPEDR
jgi:DNA-directed RNA polymerase specialized sigma24 family protein